MQLLSIRFKDVEKLESFSLSFFLSLCVRLCKLREQKTEKVGLADRNQAVKKMRGSQRRFKEKRSREKEVFRLTLESTMRMLVFQAEHSTYTHTFTDNAIKTATTTTIKN